MVQDLGNTSDLEVMSIGGSYMIRRDRLMNELVIKGRQAGIVLLYAPEAKGDCTRGSVRVIEADRAIGREVFIAARGGCRGTQRQAAFAHSNR